MLLIGSYLVLVSLPFVQDFGLTLNVSGAPPFSGGDGSTNNPFKITNVTQLQNMSANLTAHYILENDIDAYDTKFWNSGAGFAPIGTWSTTFKGDFNGNGYKISHLFINRSTTDYVGLFAVTSGIAKVRNVTLVNVSVLGNEYVGGLFGFGWSAQIRNCSTSGIVTSINNYAGGLGGITRRIDNCTSSCTVSGDWYVGGLLGAHNMYTIKDCYATGKASGTRYIGGFIGSSSASIINCYSTGNASGAQNVGGFIGSNIAAQNCFWDIDSSGTTKGSGGFGSTGLTGKTNTEMKTKSTFTNAGWDFQDTWGIYEGITSPFLLSMGVGPGSNTKFYPYFIEDIFDLQAMNEDIYGNYVLVKDIDASITYKWNWNGTAYQGFKPAAPDTDPGTSGFQGTMFKGKFDGNGKVISNLYVNRPNEDFIGLFGCYYSVPGPFNVSLIECNITGNDNVGGLMGVSYVGSTTDKCYVSGIIRGNWNVGGIVGYCRYHIKNSNSNCIVIGYSRVGGLVGYFLRGTASPINMNNCYTSGTVTGKDYVGGLVGTGDDPYFIRRCYSISDVKAEGSTPQYAGGLIGYHGWGTVEDCYSTGSVKGGNYAGGFIGSNFNGVVLNSSSSGSVTGSPTMGGFIGYNQTSGSGIIERCFFDTQTSGTSSGFGFGSSPEVVGKTTTQMMTKTTFTNAGWDFNNVWYMPVYGTRPFLRMEHNTTVRTDHQLQMMAMEPTRSYTLANEIDMSAIKEPAQMWGTSDLSGNGFAPVGSSASRFTGTFDGNDKVINNLFINRTSQSYIGLFGYTQGAEIKDLSLKDLEITGSSFVGGLIGYSSAGGTIENISCQGNISAINQYAGGLMGYSAMNTRNCSSFGHVDGVSNIGGLIGYSFSAGVTTRSFSRAIVTGSNSYIGGLVGRNYGTFSNCYTFSTIMGNDMVGGLVGENGNTILNCYSIGNVTGNTNVGGLIGVSAGSDTNCLWNPETSGKSWSDGGTGKITTQMMQKATYSSWDFNNVWGIIEDYSFPYLQWQYPEPPQAVSGIAYSDLNNGIGLGKTVDLVKVGKHLCIETTYSNGFYYFLVENNKFTSTDTMMIRIVNETTKGNTVFLTNNSGNAKNLDIFGDTINIISYSGAPINNSRLGIAKGGLTSDILYNVTANDLSLSIGIDLILDKDTIYEIEGNIIGSPTSDIYLYGPMELQDNITINTLNVELHKLDGAFSLDLLSNVDIAGDVGGTTRLTTLLIMGITYFNCSNINTTGNQDYDGATFLKNNLNLSVTGGAATISFAGTFDSIGNVHDLTIMASSNDITFDDDVGLTSALGDIVVETAHNFDINGEFHAQSFTQNSGTGTTNLGLSSLNLGGGSAIFICNEVVGNITAGSLSLKVMSANLTGSINGNSGQNGADEIVLLNVIKRGTHFFDYIDLYSFDINYGIIATEDTLYSIDYKAEYPVYASFSWSMDTNAEAWLTFDDMNAVLSGIPTNEHVGTYFVNVSVDDGEGGIDWHYFNLMVNNVPPEITTPYPTNETLEDEPYSFDFDSSDDDQGTITWSMESSASWLSMNSTTGILSGTPTNDHVGDWWVNATVDDGNGGLTSHNYSIHVNNVNDPPEISVTFINNTLEDQQYTVDFNASDIDPTFDTFTWSFHTNAVWLSLNSSTGILSGTPENKDVGSYWVNISVDDGNGGSNWLNYSLEVSNVNDPPKIWTDIVDITTANKLFSVDYEASDIDPTNDILTWSLFSNATWLSMDPITGLLSGTPADDDVGTYWVNVTVSDVNGGFDWQNFTFKVQSAGIINNNPVITTQNVLSITVIEDYEVTYAATDDRTPVNNLVWTLNTNASWLEFDNSSLVLSGTPQEKDIGRYWVNITVSDDEGGSMFTNFTLTVKKLLKPTNKNPILTNGKMTPSSGDTDTKFTFSVTYTDADDDPGDVYVWIDGNQQKMTPDESDSDFTDGVEYTHQTTLGEGPHKFYFTASDGTDKAIAGDSTPITSDDAMSTPDIKKPGETEKEDEGLDWLMIILIIIVVIIVILLIVGLLGRRKGVVEEEPEESLLEEEESEEPIDADEEIGDGEIDEVEEPEISEEFDDDLAENDEEEV
jgi:hypothetical protein